MKKLFLIIPLAILSSCTDYSRCPTGPYGEHEFAMIMYHDTYTSYKCKYCDLYYEWIEGSDYVRMQSPTSGDFFQVQKKTLYPKYINEHELK